MNNETHHYIRPPVVAVLGHVDHGKTSLLDYIRKSSVAAKEYGGITQHIGAYQVETVSDSTSGIEKITFIDTPGHEAFAKMRSRGASVADIAILVVAADDSVKPQTIESIKQIKQANIPCVVAINKIDLETANSQKVKQDLARYGVQVEGFGGDVPVVEMSAKTGKGVSELLSLIELLWGIRGGDPVVLDGFEGNVIETKVDKGKGMIATIIVKKGLLRYGVPLYEDDRLVGRVRSLHDEWGKQVKDADPGKPVQVSGFSELPTVGSVLRDVPSASKKTIVSSEQPKQTIPEFLKPIDEVQKRLPVLIKADTAGSLEAIKASLPEAIDIVSSGLGDITEADVLTAKAAGAFIVGFNVKILSSSVKLAQIEKVVCRTYTIIYELLDELADVVAGMKEITSGEREAGKATILAEFPFRDQRVAGVRVVSGRLAKGDKVKFIRNDHEIGRAKILSIRQGKIDVNKVEEGDECGVLFDILLDFRIQDDIIAVVT